MTPKNKTLEYYQSNATQLVTRYETADVADLHSLLCKAFPHPGKLLELGCGSGREAAFMVKRGHDVLATDGSREMLDQAVRSHPELGGRTMHLVLPARLGYGDDSFDGIYSIATFMHLKRLTVHQCLSEVHRCLKPGGYFLFSVSTKRSGLDANGSDPHGRFFLTLSAAEWTDMCRSTGFETAWTETNRDGLNRDEVEWFSCVVRKPSYQKMPADLGREVDHALGKFGYRFGKHGMRGRIYVNTTTQSAVMIDYQIHLKKHLFSYTEYTTEQNALMHQHDSLYRFTVDESDEIAPMVEELQRYLNRDFEEGQIKTRGIHRDLVAVDPTLPESVFEDAFIDAYGRRALNLVSREYPMIDADGQTRWIDYLIHLNGRGIAIEKNGETYHHPVFIGSERYRRQLVKQNSIVAYGNKVFRWSLEGMKFRQKFAEEMRMFFGSGNDFITGNHVSADRKFGLYQHQDDALEQIARDRELGKNSFLVVLPTGTGKTEIMISDLARVCRNRTSGFRALIMVPQVQLKKQAIQELKRRLPDYGVAVSQGCVGEKPQSEIMVQTYAWMSRHYGEFEARHFNYITVDEAHHAVAPTVRRVIHRFEPESLLGLTATDQRLDAKKLEDVFGRYDTNLTLPEAIERDILAPIKAFRLKSNIDLSQVRYNGKDYFASDLQKTVIVESRDQLIVDTLEKYFVDSDLDQKSGLVFCVSVKHAMRLAKMMADRGMSAKAVSGSNAKSAKYVEAYQEGDIQLLTTCSLLNEGWDSPRTSVIVMARPTMSKVLYTQQLGRGTRKMEGKEALYVIDVVDNYGAAGFNNAPWSIHSLLGIPDYLPWGNVLSNRTGAPNREELILAGLYESERALEKIDIFTFEREYPDHLSVEQMARELFVSTGTLKNWMKKGKVTPAVAVPVGHRAIWYFAPEQVDEIRNTMGLKIHDESTQYDDFFAFIEERTYTFSYKMVMMLNMLRLVDRNGECNLESLTRAYIEFFRGRLANGLQLDRPNCPYGQEGYLDEFDKMQQSILVNPFEKFERKRFMYHCKDLGNIAFSSTLWTRINTGEELDKIRTAYFRDLVDYYKELGGLPNEAELRDLWHIPDKEMGIEEPEKTKRPSLTLVENPEPEDRFTRFGPVYSLEAAAGAFGEAQDIETEGWVQIDSSRRWRQGMFVAKVVGRSMEPRIPNGAWCLFQGPVTGSRVGRIVLVQHHSIEDPDHGGRYTVKRYESEKTMPPDDSHQPWQHQRIVLKPINKAYEDIVIEDDAEDLKVIAEFLEVIKSLDESDPAE